MIFSTSRTGTTVSKSFVSINNLVLSFRSIIKSPDAVNPEVLIIDALLKSCESTISSFVSPCFPFEFEPSCLSK